MTLIRGSAIVAFVAVLCGVTAMAQSRIIDTPHNLSASGPGAIRASSEQQICIFCHTPHNASSVQPLWNRSAPVAAYKVYASTSLQAKPGQPTGNSKLCLSCHDGTIALGSVVSRNQSIMMSGGMTTLQPGKSNLGTDLSDDHPISFRYDVALTGKNQKLRSPLVLPPGVRLDGNQELQCTSCHDAHNNTWGKFLVMDNSQSRLCTACHNQGTTSVVSHTDCKSCHQPHTAPSGPWLLTSQTVSTTCITCHGGQPGATAGKNIAAVMQKYSKHDTNSPVSKTDHVPNNVGCSDCHEGHTMSSGTVLAPGIQPTLGRINGVSAAGAPVLRAQYEYEVCFKCHADNPTSVTMVSRQIVQPNKRLQMGQTAISYHPVMATGRNSDVPSLVPGMTETTVINCTDCHASDTSAKAGGTGPNGPHGSSSAPLLIANYEKADNLPENANTYALCYRCHQRTSILANQSFPLHKLHIVDAQAPCSACHDAHGIASTQGSPTGNAHLMNFDLAIVRNAGTAPIAYQSEGPRSGNCTLSCHGVLHVGFGY